MDLVTTLNLPSATLAGGKTIPKTVLASQGSARPRVTGTGGIQADKGMESLFSLGEVGTGTTLAFDDYPLVSFVVLR